MNAKTVLITGASSGIGFAAAQHFLGKGWNVVATMRDPARSPISTGGTRQFAVVKMDVTSPDSVREGAAEAIRRFGTVDVLVNNAGYALMGPIEAFDHETLRRQFETNVIGLSALTREILPAMRRHGGGTIINISSIGGRMAFPFAAAYHATKFAVEGLSEAMRFELKAHGVRVKLVEPGGIRTNFIARGTEWAKHPAYEPQASDFQAMSLRLNDRLPGPDKVAKVIFKAATDRSDRLRYLAAAGPYPFLHRLLPDAVWRSLVGMALRSQAGGTSPLESRAASRTDA